MATPMAEDTTSFEDDQFVFMSTEDIQRTSCLLDNEIHILKEELQRTNLELDSFKEKIKENQEKIRLNKQFSYLYILSVASIEEQYDVLHCYYRLVLITIVSHFSGALHGWYYMVFVTTIGEEYDKVFNHLDVLNIPL
nr:26S proteasome regulatory subunit 6A homolog [Tanacetum cinerariifolium]